MCIILFAYQIHQKYPLILLANRDEFYERPSLPAEFWEDFPDIYAGRDLVFGGTWLGITKFGRFAAVTNYRDRLGPMGRISRGNLVGDFLKSEMPAENYLRKIRNRAADYAGFNLIVGEINADRSEIAYYSNRADEIRFLENGIYGLSNHLLDTPWRKVRKGKSGLTELIRTGEFEKGKFFTLLQDKTLAEDAELPDTGLDYEREKLLSAIYIETPVYGTRASSLLLVDENYQISLEEITHR